MKRMITLLVLVLIVFQAQSQDAYWVGGAGNWSDAANHWANATGGAPGSATVPTFGENAIFDDNSGLAAASVVNIDVPAEADTLTFAGVSNAFVFNNAANDITLEHSLIGNVSGVTFTGIWGEVIFNASTAGEIITSGGTTWQQDFRVIGTEAMSLTDNLDISAGTMFIDAGGLNLATFDLTCFEFQATPAATKTIDIGGSTVNVTNGLWDVNGAGTTLTSASSSILLGDNAGNASFTGGALVYDTLRSSTATTLTYFDDNSFSLFEVPISSTLSIDNNADLSTDSLIAFGTCGSPMTINVPGPGANGSITKTGYPELNLISVDVSDVDAIAPALYNLQISTVTGASGWTLEAVNFYWIGNSGNWNDGAHWAFSSGGAASGCIPTIGDSVFFDANSFTLASQTVLVDDTAYFKSMDWTGSVGAQTLALDSSMVGYGDVILANNVSLIRNVVSAGIQFYDQADLSPNNATLIDCSFLILMSDPAKSVLLTSDLITTDTSSITLFNGQFNTQNNNIITGTLNCIENPLDATDARQLDFGTSSIELKGQFYALGDNSLTLNAGTSKLYIGDTLDYSNNLITEGETFYDVKLYFEDCSSCTQQVHGNNTFNKLEILPGSHVFLDSNSVQTVNDSLILKGNCLDSIFLSTTGLFSTDVADLDKAGVNTDVVMECVNLTGINASGGLALTTYFSTDLGSNTNITFDPSASITASIQPDSLLSGFCYGDTVQFQNNSTAYYAAFNEMNYEWFVNDGSLPLEDTPGLIEASNLSVQYNYPQVAGTDTSAYVQMNGWNEITDGLNLFTPATGTTNTTSGYENVRYQFTVGYRLSLVNSTGSDAYLVDMDSDPDTVSYKYIPKFKIHKNGADVGVSSPDISFVEHSFLEDTISNGVTQIGTDTVSFSVTSASVLPTDDLTIFAGVKVGWEGFTSQPRWKDGILPADNDVAISYRLDIDTIYFQAYPITSTYSIDTLTHQFQTSGDSIVVTLTATDPYTYCSATDTFFIDVTRPNISLLTSEPDTTLCPWEAVTHEAFSGVAGTQFEFFYNGVSQNTPSVNDTLFTLNNVFDNDTISVLAYEAGCVSDTMPAYVYNVFTNPVFTWTSTDADTSICAGDLVDFNAWATDSLHTFVYLLNGTGVTAFQDSIATYSTSSLADNDTVYVVAIDANNCTDTLFMDFNVDPLPPVTLAESTGGNVICENETVTFTATGADTYVFYIDGVPQGPASPTNTFVISTLQSGDSVTVEGINNNGCSKFASQIFNYIVTPLPTVNMISSDADSSICSFESVTFSATSSPPATYEFFINGVSAQGPSGTAGFTPGTLNDGDVIYVEGTAAGCTATSTSVTMEVLAAPTTTLTNNDNGDNTICGGTSVTFTSTGATTYEFFVDGSSVQGPSATNTYTTTSLTNGDVIMVVGESNTCTVSQSQTFTVLVNPIVSLFVNDADSTICDGDPITFTGSNAAQYEFFVNGTSIQGPSTTTTLVNPSIPVGSNTVYVTGIAGNGCTDDSPIIDLTVNAIPAITATSSDGDNIICAGESVTFTGAGGDNYQFFLNGTPQGSMSPTNTFTTNSLTNGQTLTITGSLLGCVSNSTGITTTVNPVPNVTLSSTDVDNIYCDGTVVTYTGAGANNYEFFVDGTSQGPSSPVDNINSTGFSIGTFVVQVVGESNNCFNTANYNVIVNPLPVASLASSDGDNTICTGETVVYTGSGGVLYEFFVNGVSQGTLSPTDNMAINTLVNGDIVSVQVTSPDGCTDIDTYAAITVNPVPTVTLTSSQPTLQICGGDNVDFTASGATDYEFFINGLSQGAPSPTNVLSTTGLNNGDDVSVVGTSIGCSASSGNMTFTVYGPPVVNLTNNGDNQLCVGENSDLTAFGATNYEFFVNGVSQGASSPVDFFTSPLNNGDVVTVEGETNGCVNASLDTYTFTVYNYPTLASSSTGTTICLNDLVTFTASGAMTYDFEINGTLVQSGATSTYSTSSLLDGDVVTITGYNGDCASTVDTYTFTVNSMNLDLTVSTPTMICAGDLVTFTASGADQYEFFLNGTSVAPMGVGNTYSSTSFSDMDQITFVGYNNTTMCTQDYDDYVILNVIDEPTITPLSNIDFCDGDSVILVSNLPYGNQWYVDGNPIPGATDTSYVAYTTGVYSLDVASGGQGDVWSFGQNATGNFGSGDNMNNADPTAAVTTVQFDELAAGFAFVLGVTTTGELYAWGENSSGQLGNGTYTSSNLPQTVPTLANVKTAATTETSSMAVTNAGEVYVWGNNAQGQLGTGNTAVINFPFLNAAIANVDSIAGGRDHFIILKNDGTVWAVGNNDYGQLGQGNLSTSFNAIQVPGLTNVVSVGAGEYHSFAIDNTGALYVWGNNGSGQLGLGDLNNRLDPTLSQLVNIVNAQGGASHSAFLSADNKVYTSGANGFGQLGSGNYNDTLLPMEVNLPGAAMISTGQYTTLVKRLDNSVFGFGNNTEDQLSSPSGLSVPTPEHITDLDGVSYIEASQSASHFIYGNETACSSQTVNVNNLAVPAVTITANVDTLTATAGASYQWYFEGSVIPGATSQTYVANGSGNYSVEVTFANGCTGLSPEYYHSMSSIDDLSFGTISLYPNPAKNIVNVEFSNELDGEFEVIVLDQTGRVVSREMYNNTSTVTIDISTIENGVYNVSIMSSDARGTLRFVKTDK